MATQDQLSFGFSVPRLCKLVNQELQQPEASQERRMFQHANANLGSISGRVKPKNCIKSVLKFFCLNIQRHRAKPPSIDKMPSQPFGRLVNYQFLRSIAKQNIRAKLSLSVLPQNGAASCAETLRTSKIRRSARAAADEIQSTASTPQPTSQRHR